MLIRHLFYFVTLAKEKHFARAAEICNVTQPTLSSAIRKLEEDLDAHLVVRDQRFIKLTLEGEKLLIWGRQIIKDYKGLRDDLSSPREALSGVLKIGVIPAALPMISYLTTPFAKAYPASSMEIFSMSSISIQKAIDAFEIDTGLTYLNNEPLQNVRCIPFYDERYLFVVNRYRLKGNQTSITWREVAAEPLCLLRRDMQFRRILDNVALSIGTQIEVRIVTDSFLAICSHVNHGPWASIIPHTFSYIFKANPDLALLDLVEPTHSQTIGLVMSDREPLGAMSNALLETALKINMKSDFETFMAKSN